MQYNHYKKKDIIQQILLQQKNNRSNIYTIASLGLFIYLLVIIT